MADSMTTGGRTMETICSAIPPSTRDFENFKAALPGGYDYHYCLFTSEDRNFEARIHVSLCDVDGAQRWLKDYQEHAKVTWRVEATKPESGRINLFKTYYRCQHNTKPRTDSLHQGSKDCKCPAKLTLTVKRLQGKHSTAKLKDCHLPVYPMMVELKHNHNHHLVTSDILKYRDVCEETIQKFRELFTKGHSPSSALNTHKIDIQLEFGEDYATVTADRSKCPDLQFCYRLYRKIFDKAYGASSGEKMLLDVEAALNRYNTEQGMETYCETYPEIIQCIGGEESVTNMSKNVSQENKNTNEAEQIEVYRQLKKLSLGHSGKFLENWNPATSKRERRKSRLKKRLNNSNVSMVKRRGQVYNSWGVRFADNKNICDCLDMHCPGCHFPCPSCKSPKCGIECRCNRRWSYTNMEIEGC